MVGAPVGEFHVFDGGGVGNLEPVHAIHDDYGADAAPAHPPDHLEELVRVDPEAVEAVRVLATEPSVCALAEPAGRALLGVFALQDEVVEVVVAGEERVVGDGVERVLEEPEDCFAGDLALRHALALRGRQG